MVQRLVLEPERFPDGLNERYGTTHTPRLSLCTVIRPHTGSVCVERCGEDDVPADGQGGFLHLAAQHGVSYDPGSLADLLQHLIQPLDAPHHRPLLDVGQLGDLRKRLGRGEDKSINHLYSEDTDPIAHTKVIRQGPHTSVSPDFLVQVVG